MGKYVIYYRVSTKKQGDSHLGLDAQRAIVNNFLNNIEPIDEFIDIESGTSKGNGREGLKQAIKKAKEVKGILVIAKLDRLARNVRFITTLMEGDVEFIACDMPAATKFTIHIFAALAEQEAEMISIRTKQALKELKNRGVKLGRPENLTKTAITKGLLVRRNNALNNDDNRKATALIVSLYRDNYSFYKITHKLNDLGFTTRRGTAFQTTQVKRLYDRHMETIPAL